MKGTSMLLIAALSAVPAMGNEALDLLEGNDTAGILYGPGALPQGVGPVAVDPGWETDYAIRWLTQLPPLWVLYEDTNPVVQAAALTGLFEWRLDHGSIEADGGGGVDQDVDSSGARRARLGAVLRAFYNTDLEAGVVFDGDADYHGIDKLKATVHASDSLSIAFGKFRPPFALEHTQDPSVRWVPEMAPLTSQIVPSNSLGVMASGDVGAWDWGLGWFSRDRAKNLPGIEGNGYVLAKVGYTFQGPPGGDKNAEGGAAAESDTGQDVFQRWHLDYIYNLDQERSDSIPMGYEHLLATGLQVSSGRFDFLGDFLLANGQDNTAWGMTLQGAYWLLEDAVRAVARYSYGDTDDEGGLMMGWGIADPDSDSLHPFRYPIVQTGDELHTFYGGLNLHFFGDYLIVQVGAEYRLLKNSAADVPDLSSWLWQVGGRAAF